MLIETGGERETLPTAPGTRHANAARVWLRTRSCMLLYTAPQHELVTSAVIACIPWLSVTKCHPKAAQGLKVTWHVPVRHVHLRTWSWSQLPMPFSSENVSLGPLFYLPNFVIQGSASPKIECGGEPTPLLIDLRPQQKKSTTKNINNNTWLYPMLRLLH